MIGIDQALRMYLARDPQLALAAPGGVSVGYARPAQLVGDRYVAIIVDDQAPIYHTRGQSDRATSIVRTVCRAPEVPQRNAIVAEVLRLLSGLRGTIEGVHVGSCFAQAIQFTPAPAQDGRDAPDHQAIINWRVFHTVDAPAYVEV